MFLLAAILSPPAMAAGPDSALAARAAPRKGLRHVGRDDLEVPRLVIKFQEGARVRQRDGKLAQLSAERSERERSHLARLGLSASRIDADLASLDRLLAGSPRTQGVRRLFTAPEETLAARKVMGEMRTGHELADLDLYVEVPLKPGSTHGQVKALVAAIEALPAVESAYAEPAAEPAMLNWSQVPALLLGATPNFQSLQGYLGAAPVGLEAQYAWTVPGGNGAGVRIVDVEGAWRTTHEDLPGLFRIGGAQINDLSWRNHGTAVLGEMVGVPNGLGVTGMAFGAQAGVEGIANQSTASAITNAALAVGEGGVVLIELHRSGPPNSSPCTCNTSQCDFIPLEFWQADFDAILQASVNGAIIVEAGGNGSSNLDDSAYNGAFNVNNRDSRAILVGATTSSSLSPTCWTNHGSRVNLHAWGENVMTLGYGSYYNGGTEDSYYTASFSGTSSASPMIAASVASLQGALRAAGRPPLTALGARNLLVSTGSPQQSDPKHVGPRPNLRAAIQSLNLCNVAGAPSLISPANGSSGAATSPLLDWSDVAGATSYEVQVAADSGFTNVVRSQTGLTSSQWTVTPALSGGATYFWRARAVNGCGAGAWSGGFSFTITTTTPIVPFSFMSNHAVIYPDRVLLTATFWNGTGVAATITARGLVDQSGTAFVTGGTCTVGSSLASGASCTVVIYAPRDCFDYTVAATVSNAAGTRIGGYYTVGHYGEICQ